MPLLSAGLSSMRLCSFLFFVCVYNSIFTREHNGGVGGGDGWVAFVQRKQHQRLLLASFTSVIFVVTEKVATTRCQNHALLYIPALLQYLVSFVERARPMDIFRVISSLLFFFLFIIYVYFFSSSSSSFDILTYSCLSFFFSANLQTVFFFLFSFYYLVPFFFFFLRLCSAGARLKWGTGSIPAGRMPA